MTVEVIVRFDGWHCKNSCEINSGTDADIEHIGWLIDYRTGLHFCKKCRPIIEEEIRIMDEEESIPDF